MLKMLPISQLYLKCMYIERLPSIAELVISPYPTIPQQFIGFKKLSFVGDICTLTPGLTGARTLFPRILVQSDVMSP